MFWLSFVYPRSHSGWIGPIGEFAAADFTHKPAYRYSILISFDLNSIWGNRLAFLMLFHTSRIGWLAFCIFWLRFVSQSVRVTCLSYLLTVLCIRLIGWLVWLHLVRCLAVLFSCYSLAGTEASKQALKTKLRMCNIAVWGTSETQQQQSIYFARKTSDQSKY